MKHLLIFLASFSSFASAQSSSSMATDVVGALSCPDLRSKIFDTYYQAYEHPADLASLQTELKKSMSQSPSQQSVMNIHSLLTTEISALKNTIHARRQPLRSNELGDDENRDVLHLIRLEMRSQIEPEYAAINRKLDQALSEAAARAQQEKLACTRREKMSDVQASASSMNEAIYGAHFTMATAYQSCRVLDLPAVNSSVENVQGVERGAKVDSVGYGRVYTDVALLKQTHYYHRGQTYGPECANQDRKPLVYDYGGVPVVGDSSLDLFSNDGGGPALGIDCSAFVSTAAAVAGNRYSPSTSNKPVYSRFVSRDFINPEVSGWSCYDSVKVNEAKSLQAGDIAAVEGHVVMVDEVGADPFGLDRVRSISECDDLSYNHFDFTIIQSSPSKNSLGINRFLIRDYLPGENKMQSMFVGYGKQACRSKFDHVVRKPATSVYGIIRHNQKSSCLAPKVQLKNEACVQRCAALQP